MNTIMERGGRVKNLYDPSGKRFLLSSKRYIFSALGERAKVTLAERYMFMPGIPQVWYLDVFAGK
jgi:sucrose phosphorylase